MASPFIPLEFSTFGLPLPSVSTLTFLILQPELLLGLLAGEVDAAAELGAVQGLGHVVAAVLLEKGQQLPSRALCRQCLQHLRKAYRVKKEMEEVCTQKDGLLRLSLLMPLRA